MKKILPLAIIGLVVYAFVKASKNGAANLSPEEIEAQRQSAILATQGRDGAVRVETIPVVTAPNRQEIIYAANMLPNSAFTMPADVGVGRIPNPIN